MRNVTSLIALLALALFVSQANGTIMSVSGPNSTGAGSAGGTAPAIIAAPSDALDDFVVNTGMEGFDEAQDVTTSVAYTMDSGVLAAGSFVDSHMIFLNSEGNPRIDHIRVVWTFANPILGVMSNRNGSFEAASTGELGNPLTNYTVGAAGQIPPFAARGLESNNGTGWTTGDGYAILDPFTLRVSMAVTEPGDWIRVVTAAVPEPGSIVVWSLIGLTFAGIGWRRRRKA